MTSPRIAYLLKKFPRLSETFVLDEAMRRRAGEMGDRIRQEHGVENAVHFIEQVGLTALF